MNRSSLTRFLFLRPQSSVHNNTKLFISNKGLRAGLKCPLLVTSSAAETLTTKRPALSRSFFKFGGGNSIKEPTEVELKKMADSYTLDKLRKEFGSRVSTMDGYFVSPAGDEKKDRLTTDMCLAIVWQSSVLASQRNNAVAAGTTEYRANFLDKDMKKYEQAFLLSLEYYETLLEESNSQICANYKVDEKEFTKSFDHHYKTDTKFASLVDLFMQNGSREKPDEFPKQLTDAEYLHLFTKMCGYLQELKHTPDPSISEPFRVCYATDRYFKEFGVNAGLTDVDKQKMGKDAKKKYLEFLKMARGLGY